MKFNLVRHNQHSDDSEKGQKEKARNLEARWKMTEDSRLRSGRNRVDKLRILREKKGTQMNKLIDTPCEGNIDTAVEEYISSKDKYSDIIVFPMMI